MTALASGLEIAAEKVLASSGRSGSTAGMDLDAVGVRTFGNGQYYGRFMLKPEPGSKPSLQARLVAVTLADQAGRAFGAGQTTRSPR